MAKESPLNGKEIMTEQGSKFRTERRTSEWVKLWANRMDYFYHEF